MLYYNLQRSEVEAHVPRIIISFSSWLYSGPHRFGIMSFILRHCVSSPLLLLLIFCLPQQQVKWQHGNKMSLMTARPVIKLDLALLFAKEPVSHQELGIIKRRTNSISNIFTHCYSLSGGVQIIVICLPNYGLVRSLNWAPLLMMSFFKIPTPFYI